jgi:pyruvate kinase
MIVVPDYRGHRIEVNAVAFKTADRWNAEVRTREHAVNAKPHVEIVTCLKRTADHAERSAEIWARRWIDLNGGA